MKIYVVVLSLALTACASYQSKVDSARSELRNNPIQAAEKLKPLASVEGKDQLVYLFDYGTALQAAGNYKDSSQILIMADKMSEVKDYHSITDITASLLFNEGQIAYKGDDYEKVIINALLAYNFLMMNDLDSALVEVRRLNEKLNHYRVDAKRDYEQNVFATYVSAMIWEADRKWDDAYIDYKKAHKLAPEIPYLKEDLIRASAQAQRPEDNQKWREEFKIKPKPEWQDKSRGEIVLIYQQGWGPRKYPHPNFARIPKLYPVFSLTQSAKLMVEGGPAEVTQKIYSVQDVAIKTLDDAYTALIAKRAAGVVVKEVIADQIKQKNELLGTIVQLGMHLSDQADLRQWSTLPESFQVARILLKPGKYKIMVQGLDSSNNPSGEQLPYREIQVKAGKKTFVGRRSFL